MTQRAVPLSLAGDPATGPCRTLTAVQQFPGNYTNTLGFCTESYIFKRKMAIKYTAYPHTNLPNCVSLGYSPTATSYRFQTASFRLLRCVRLATNYEHKKRSSIFIVFFSLIHYCFKKTKLQNTLKLCAFITTYFHTYLIILVEQNDDRAKLYYYTTSNKYKTFF